MAILNIPVFYNSFQKLCQLNGQEDDLNGKRKEKIKNGK